MGGFALHVLALTGAGTVKRCVWFNLLGDNPAPFFPETGEKKKKASFQWLSLHEHTEPEPEPEPRRGSIGWLGAWVDYLLT